jgi:Ca2+-transporting ATPase
LVLTVHDAVKGRARFKVEGLYRSDPIKCIIEKTLAGQAGIDRYSVSLLTGKVLVFFNSGNTTEKVRSLIEAAVTAHSGNGRRAGKSRPLREAGNAVIHAAKKQGNSATEEIHRTKSRRKIRKSVLVGEQQKVDAWHLRDVREVVDALDASPEKGLSRAAAQESLARYGPNLLPESVPRSGLSIFWEQFTSLPVALLGVAAGISVATGGIADALVIAGVVIINGIIGYTTETQAEKTIHALKGLVRPSALCLREGALSTMPAEEIVPGDILVLRPGSYVAADARLIDANHLSIDESALTGESMPAVKSVRALEGEDVPLADRKNMVYMGTLVTGGQGLAVVVATGRYTEIGTIQTLVGEARPPETPMERQLDRMGKQLVYISGAVCGLVFVIGLLRGYGLLQMLKTSIALAVAAVPEGLPMVATTTLALGIRTMKKHNVLIRHLDAVETLGSVQTICLDKTGTITWNRMSVVRIYAGMRRMAVADGRFRVEAGEVNPYDCDELLRLINISVLCSESEVSREDGGFAVRGSSTENAFIHVALGAGISVPELRAGFPLLRVRHRSENCNIMITFHTVKPDDPNHGKAILVAAKGSPQEVLSLCSHHIRDGMKLPLSEEDRDLIRRENERMAGDALRVLGFASAVCDESAACFNTSDTCGVSPEDMDLVWLGLAGMIDPIRDGVRQEIRKYHEAGIDTVMITGDQGPTAYAIGKELNLARGEQLEILDSTHLSAIAPEVLRALTTRVHVFARVSPANKLQIVQALQSSGRVVAMTGDGINDGPALKAADIGIAMGHTGTDVAREVADVVLEDDNIETMIIAISQGRTIYNNIRKSVHFLLATNMSEIMVMLGAITAGIGQPLNAMQLLWINLMSDIAPGLALALESPEPDVLNRPPRNPDEPIIRREDFTRIGFESAMLSAGAMGAYGYGIARYGMGAQAGTMAFMSLTFGQIIHAISCRSEQFSIFDKKKIQPNRFLDAALAGSLALQGLAIVVPGLRSLLGLAHIGIADGLVVGGTALAPLLVNEATKRTIVLSGKVAGQGAAKAVFTADQPLEEVLA